MMSLFQKKKLRLWPSTWYRDKMNLRLALLALIFNLHFQVSGKKVFKLNRVNFFVLNKNDFQIPSNTDGEID